MAKRAYYESPEKSAYSIEYCDSNWEWEYMEELEKDDTVTKWTKNHGIRIPYCDSDGIYRYYNPDFLVEKEDGTIELIEMKGTHMLELPNTLRKKEFAEKWCKARSIRYRLISKYQ